MILETFSEFTVWLCASTIAAFLSSFIMKPAKTVSAPVLYGGYAALASAGGGTIILFLYAMLSKWLLMPYWPIYPLLAVPAILAITHARKLQYSGLSARAGFERLILWSLASCTALAVLTTIGIIIAIASEAVKFFHLVPINEFLFSTVWSPQIAIREDQAAAQGAFGLLPLLCGTLLITTIAMTLATPIGLVIAAYLSEFASSKTRVRIKPLLEMLAGIPTVVYGFFAVTVLSPLLRDLGNSLGVQMTGESALAAGIVIGIMLIPFITSLSEDALFAAPDSLRQGALALGATRFETTFQIMIPAAAPGIAAGILLALSRAIGETMIVVMAAGIAAHLTVNPLEAVTTVTVQIVTLLTGDQEFDDPKTLAAFALGLTLFIITLILNLFALQVSKKHQQEYD